MKKDKPNLDDEMLIRISEIQNLIKTERGEELSIEEILTFLGFAMNFGEFQIWLLENEYSGVNLSSEEILKKFLTEKSDKEILGTYDVLQNTGEKKLENVRRHIESEKSVSTTTFRPIETSHSTDDVNFNKKSLEKNAKILLRPLKRKKK